MLQPGCSPSALLFHPPGCRCSPPTGCLACLQGGMPALVRPTLHGLDTAGLVESCHARCLMQAITSHVSTSYQVGGAGAQKVGCRTSGCSVPRQKAETGEVGRLNAPNTFTRGTQMNETLPRTAEVQRESEESKKVSELHMKITACRCQLGQHPLPTAMQQRPQRPQQSRKLRCGLTAGPTPAVRSPPQCPQLPLPCRQPP